MSDQQRRIEIQVGIASGSDTDKVSELLLALARDHEDVLEHPEPYVIFSSFEDSSLKFSLRAWIGRFGDFLRVRSELTAAVNKALGEAGITIPFPQRDVHLRSGDAWSAEGSTEKSNRGLKPDSPGKEDHRSKPDLAGTEE
jgi:small-conductance mechanosensitive channel